MPDIDGSAPAKLLDLLEAGSILEGQSRPKPKRLDALKNAVKVGAYRIPSGDLAERILRRSLEI